MNNESMPYTTFMLN